jgi:HD-like signal output (HDOD) protein
VTSLIKSESTLFDRIVAEVSDFNESNPSLVPRLMTMTSDASTPVSDLAVLLSHDPALTTTVLRLANSAFFGRSRSVATVEEAVTVLGFSLLRSIVMTANMVAVFGPGGENKHKQALWDHSFAVALGARMVAGCLGRVVPEEAFLVGLMHDVGLLVLLHRYPAEYKPLILESMGDMERQLKMENDLLGVNHAQLGATLLENWKFPPRTIEAVRFHHAPEEQVVPPTRVNDGGVLAHIVCFADHLASSLGYGLREAHDVDWARFPSVEQLHLTPESIAWIAQNLNQRFAEERLFLMSS